MLAVMNDCYVYFNLQKSDLKGDIKRRKVTLNKTSLPSRWLAVFQVKWICGWSTSKRQEYELEHELAVHCTRSRFTWFTCSFDKPQPGKKGFYMIISFILANKVKRNWPYFSMSWWVAYKADKESKGLSPHTHTQNRVLLSITLEMK